MSKLCYKIGREKTTMKRKIIYAGISCLICLLTLEVSIRILSRYSDKIRILTFYKFDNSQFNHINNLESLLKKAPSNFKPYQNWGGFILNSKGLRTPEYQTNKSPNSIRVIAIGDSFVSDSGSVPYPYHFTVLLEKKLKIWLKNDNVELINLGVPAVGPQFEKKMLEIEGVRLKPDASRF